MAMKAKDKIGRALFCAMLAAFIFAVLPAQIASSDQVRIFKIKYRVAKELLPIVQVALSPTGSATVDARTNSIVVRDSPQGIGRVQKILAQQDILPVVVLITIHEVSKNELTNLGLKVDWQIQNGQWTVGRLPEKNNGVWARAGAGVRRGSSSMASSRSLRVQSGGKGVLSSGASIQVIPGRIDYYQKFGFKARDISGASYQTSFEIEPVITGDYVRIKLTPVITMITRKGPIQKRLTASTLEVRVPIGGSLLVGAGKGRTTDSTHDLFMGYSRSLGRSESYMVLEVKVDRDE